MDSFYNLFMNFAKCQRVRNFSEVIKNILICVLKINESLRGLEQHEGE